jgi:hypothetical protein
VAILLSNCTVDVYRGFNPASPYPNGAPDVPGVKAYIRHHMKNGRFGYNDSKIKWTHLLLANPGTDIRSAYNSWTGPGEPTQNADTVVISDYPQVGLKTAFYVVMVQRRRGKPGDSYKVYLDKCRTKYPVVLVNVNCGQCQQMPQNWTLTTGASDYANHACTGCQGLNGMTYTLTYAGAGCDWYSASLPEVCHAGEAVAVDEGPVRWHLFYQGGLGWRLFLEEISNVTSLLAFDPIADANWNCQASNTFVNPVWADNACNSTASATIVLA